MSAAQVLNRIQLQSIVAILLVLSLLAVLAVLLFLTLKGKIVIAGQVDVAIVMGFFISAVSTALGWLYGRQQKQ